MSIYRGAGGAGDAINDSSSEATLVQQLAIAAQASADSASASNTAAANSASGASSSASAASTSASNAATSATNASNSASTATTQATNAATSATAAQTAETAAELAETNAETAETNAASSASAASTSASNAATSATNASNSASAASTSATNASNSATAASTSASNASTSATSASGSASSATTSASNASTSATNASNSATSASTSASTATTQAGIATTQASNASTSATNASNSATSASGSASTATTQATNASNSASAAATSATNASNSASSASTSATNAANSATLAASYTPSQTGNSGKFLTTDGTNTSWGTPTAGTGTVTSVAATVPSFLSIAGSPITTSGTLAFTYSGTALPVANGGTGSTTSTGSGAVVLGTSPTLTTPTIDKINTSVTNTSLGAGNASIMKNRIINGAMVVNQRATAITASGYTVDRFAYFGSQASKVTISQDTSVFPTGFNASLKVISSSAYTVGSTEEFEIYQSIEGLNVADLGWGTADAKTVTLSFQVYSSLTGTFGGALQNGAGNRSYPFSYSIPVANTWTQISVTIVGDTSGTWLKNNGIGIAVYFGLGVGSTKSGTAGVWSGSYLTSVTGATSVVGTNGATWYITGVQLEVGTQATGFEYRQYGQELALCQRYFEKASGNMYSSYGATINYLNWYFKATKRTAPTVTGLTGTTGELNFDFTSGYSTGANYASYSNPTASAEL